MKIREANEPWHLSLWPFLILSTLWLITVGFALWWEFA